MTTNTTRYAYPQNVLIEIYGEETAEELMKDPSPDYGGAIELAINFLEKEKPSRNGLYAKIFILKYKDQLSWKEIFAHSSLTGCNIPSQKTCYIHLNWFMRHLKNVRGRYHNHIRYGKTAMETAIIEIEQKREKYKQEMLEEERQKKEKIRLRTEKRRQNQKLEEERKQRFISLPNKEKANMIFMQCKATLIADAFADYYLADVLDDCGFVALWEICCYDADTLVRRMKLTSKQVHIIETVLRKYGVYISPSEKSTNDLYLETKRVAFTHYSFYEQREEKG